MIYPVDSVIQPLNNQALQRFTVPAAYFLEPLYNAVKMRPFLRIVIPAIHHQLYVFWLHFHGRDVWTEWWVFMRYHTVNDHCLKV